MNAEVITLIVLINESNSAQNIGHNLTCDYGLVIVHRLNSTGQNSGGVVEHKSAGHQTQPFSAPET